ncbi:DUF305 domain-containing protein [Kineococcus sp. NUM-3379]
MTARRAALAAAALLVALLAGVLAGRALPTAPGEASVDVGFCRDMADHHAQAVAMALEAVRRTGDGEVRTLAVDVLLTQQNQIGRMQALLGAWERPIASAGPPMAWMGGPGGHGGHEGAAGSAVPGMMPGMASAAEMAELGRLGGRELEVRFLQLMLRHHEGGFDMAAHAREHATTAQVRDLARSIADGQRQEAEVLTDLLRERGGEPLPLVVP